jgi:sporulation protein YlmC with PRC-barrel domain
MSYADHDKYGMYKGSDSTGPGPALMGADTLIGDNVVNGQEQDLGEIKEIMIDMRNGEVAYAVLSFGGFLGMGEKLFAVPWQALELDTVNKRFVLNVDKDRLQSAPGFDPDNWPDMSEVGWANQVHSFYGTDQNRTGSSRMSSGMGAGAGAGASMGSATSSSMGSGAGSGSSMGSGTGAGMGSAAGGSAGAGTGSGAGGDLGAKTAAGTGSASGSSATGSTSGTGTSPGTGTGGTSSGGTRGDNI